MQRGGRSRVSEHAFCVPKTLAITFASVSAVRGRLARVLYDPAAHEPLHGPAWSESRVREAVAAIVAYAEAAYDPERFWPLHPSDFEEGEPEGPYTTWYLGAIGVVWALAQLGSRDWREEAAHIHDAYLAEPDYPGAEPSFYMGETGIALVRWLLDPQPELLDRLEQLIPEAIPRPELDAMWAAAGAMEVALFLHERTGEERWAELVRASASHLLETQRDDGLWTEERSGGRTGAVLGAIHGWAGNVHPLLRARGLVDVRALEQSALDVLGRTAMRDGELVNWPPAPDGRKVRVQWCHGAPGVVTALADLPGALDLLRAGAELIWEAGPLRKGSNLCHGTGGNGYAFLKLHRLTGEELWLERARAFAMHALGQWERTSAEHGVGRYSLWTGDPGLALFLQACIDVDDRLPGLDVL